MGQDGLRLTEPALRGRLGPDDDPRRRISGSRELGDQEGDSPLSLTAVKGTRQPWPRAKR